MELTNDQAAMLGGILLGGIRNEYEITRKVLAAVPADQLDFKLGEKGRTMRALMHHIVESEISFADFLVSGQLAPEAEAGPEVTKEQVLARFENDLPAAMDRVAALDGAQLARKLDFFGLFNYPTVVYMNFWSAHTVHHRGQLSTYLRALNAYVPSIYGGSADEAFGAATTA